MASEDIRKKRAIGERPPNFGRTNSRDLQNTHLMRRQAGLSPIEYHKGT